MPSQWEDDELDEELADDRPKQTPLPRGRAQAKPANAAEEEATEQPAPKRAGRPKGSKNKSRESLLTNEKLESLYNRIKPFLPDDQRAYTEGIISGESDVDPLKEMKLLVRQMSIIFSEASVWHFENKRVSQDFGQFANSLRMSIKDLHDMLKQEDAKNQEDQNTNDLVPITQRGSSMERLDAFLSEHPS